MYNYSYLYWQMAISDFHGMILVMTFRNLGE